MNRSARSHRSTKIPGVRIKPPPAVGADAKASTSRRRLEDEGDGEALAHYRQLRDGVLEEADRRGKRTRQTSGREEEEDNEESTKPLLGCVLCMSGVTGDKGMLSSYATAMGARVEGNLTEDATHLIAPMPGSEKYRCAVQLGIPILRPAWVAELRERWTNFEEYNFEQLMEQHRLGPFENFGVGLAGFTNRTERYDLRQRLQAGGAATPEVFTLDGKITHLISATSKTADSKTLNLLTTYRRKAERFLRRGEPLPSLQEHGAQEIHAAHEIRIVSKDWLEDSLEMGVCMDTDLYDILGTSRTVRQRDDFKRGIEEARQRSEAKLQRNMAAAKERAARHVEEAVGVRRRKKEEATEPGRPSRPLGPMSGLLAPNGDTSSLRDVAKESQGLSHVKQSRLQSLSREKSFGQAEKLSASSDVDCPRASPTKPPIGTEKTQNAISDHVEIDSASGLGQEEGPMTRHKDWTAAAFRMDLKDEGRNQRLSKALRLSSVAKVVSHYDDSQDADFCVVPLSCVERHEQVGDKRRGALVTHLFVERCMHESRLVDAKESFALQPCPTGFPVAGARDTFVAVTGLSEGIEQHQALAALKEAGLQTSSTLKRSAHTHLLCGSDADRSESSRLKRQRAKEWGIPIVGLDFIQRIYSEGKVEPPASSSALKRAIANRPLGQTQFLKARSLNSDDSASVPGGESLGETQRFDEESSGAETPAAEEKATRGPVTANSGARKHEALLPPQEQPGQEPKRAAAAAASRSEPSLGDSGSLATNGVAQEVLDLINGNAERQPRRRDSSPNPRRVESGASSSSSSSGHTDRTKRTRGKQGPPARRRGTSNVEEQDNAEEMLARQREAEKMRAALMSQPQTLSMHDSSLRVVYEDPASKKAWKQMNDLIGGVNNNSSSSSSSTDSQTVEPK
ncbi:hypothetical protein FA10DRAFT_265521 [Acaromyces ingoldii]|uniref:BRCT domain-containing protein n=1 Tax=Acaromyces ingoldii TaxID=215250 RepID=A0A316YVC6_9BASI|nr:hypothetical protein FA10DRAFT_265521 [Acaromyces ingoldii]PWN91675.1 hypothetical protein FA10DRAFT_265521 [Acaromyces ingoldii]